MGGGEDARIGETGFQRDGVPAFENGHVMAVARKEVGGCDARDAGSDDGDAQRLHQNIFILKTGA